MSHADECVVDGLVAVWVVAFDDFTDDGGGFDETAVGLDGEVSAHGVEDSALDGFEAVADIRQGTAGDDGEGVVEVTGACGVGEGDVVDFGVRRWSLNSSVGAVSGFSSHVRGAKAALLVIRASGVAKNWELSGLCRGTGQYFRG